MDEWMNGSMDERTVDTMNGVPDATFLPLSVEEWNG